LIRRRAGNVADGDGGCFLALGEAQQRLAANGRVKRRIQSSLLIVKGAGGMAKDDLGAVPVWNRYIDAALAKRKQCFHVFSLNRHSNSGMHSHSRPSPSL